MDPMATSPTRNDVVRETMKRNMEVAVETNQEYSVVTYDLAVALKAYSIQSLEAPMFDGLLIMLGNFHVDLSFTSVLGPTSTNLVLHIPFQEVVYCQRVHSMDSYEGTTIIGAPESMTFWS